MINDSNSKMDFNREQVQIIRLLENSYKKGYQQAIHDVEEKLSPVLAVDDTKVYGPK
jgi:hypothetical protein